MNRMPFVVLFALATSFPARASAADPTKQECVAVSESAQILKHSGKLRASRAEFQKCSVDSCPAVIHADCTEQLRAVMRDLPTVVFSGAEDRPSLQISMDGERLGERLDGAYVVDPGDHSFTFVSEGGVPVSKQLTIRAGEKGRREVVPSTPLIVTKTSPASTLEPVPNVVYAKPETASFAAPGRPASNALFHNLAYVSVGAGVLSLTTGVVFGIVAKTTYDGAKSHCRANACDVEGVADGRSAHAFAAVGTGGFVIAAVFLAGGAALLLFGPKSSVAKVGRNGGLVW